MGQMRVGHHEWRQRAIQSVAFSGGLLLLAFVLSTSVLTQQIEKTVQATAVAVKETGTVAAQFFRAPPDTPMAIPRQPISPANVDQVEQLTRWGKGQIQTFAWSPDGRWAAIGSSTGTYIYDARTREQVCYLAGETTKAAGGTIFSPDGQILAVSSGKSTQLWRIPDGELLATLNEHPGEPEHIGEKLVFSPDGHFLARFDSGKILNPDRPFYLRGEVTVSNSLIEIYRMPGGESMWQHEVAGKEMAFSPDGSTLTVTTEDGALHVYRTTDGTILQTVEPEAFSNQEYISLSLSLAPDGQSVALVYSDTVRIRRVDDGRLLQSWETAGHNSRAKFSPDGRFFVVWGDIPGLWRVADGTLVYSWDGWVPGVDFSPDGHTLAIAPSGIGHVVNLSTQFGVTYTVDLWQIENPQLLFCLPSCDQGWQIGSLGFSPDGQTLATYSLGGVLQFWRVGDGTLLGQADEYYGPVGAVAFSPDGEMLAAALADNTVRTWRVTDGKSVHTLPSETMDLHNWLPIEQQRLESGPIAFSPDGRLLAVGNLAGDNVDIWRLADSVVELDRLCSHPSGVAFSPDGRTLAVAGMGSESIENSGTVRLWEVSTGERLWSTREIHWNAVAISPNGRIIAAAGGDDSCATNPDACAVYLWRAEDQQLLRVLRGHTGPVRSLAFSPDGTTLASAGEAVRLWQVEDGALLYTIEPKAGEATETAFERLAFSPDGQIIATAGNTLRLWRATDGAFLRQIEHQGYVTGLAFSPNGAMLLSGTLAGSIYIWGISR